MRQDLETLPENKQYIHAVHFNRLKDAGFIIVTTFPELAALAHSVVNTQHDGTYKRLRDETIEWEVVAWSSETNSSEFWRTWLLTRN
jgi:hypothetical protein